MLVTYLIILAAFVAVILGTWAFMAVLDHKSKAEKLAARLWCNEVTELALDPLPRPPKGKLAYSMLVVGPLGQGGTPLWRHYRAPGRVDDYGPVPAFVRSLKPSIVSGAISNLLASKDPAFVGKYEWLKDGGVLCPKGHIRVKSG